MKNNLSISEFIIVGFSDISHYQNLIFTLLLLLFFIIIAGNVFVLLVIVFNSRLQIPMYLYICTLSVIEIGIVATVYPTFFTIVLKGKAHISLNCCFIQMYIIHSLVITENYLLNVMAYDRYLAICKALRYHIITTLRSCKILIFACLTLGFLTPLALVTMVYRLPFCGPNKIKHLFCDSSPLLTLACANSDINVIMDFSVSYFTIILTSFFIIWTYTNILATILKMKTSEERKKAFSTCASHLIISLLYYGSAAFMYIQLQADYSPEYDLATAIHQTVLTPLLSPLVYCFRNKEIKNFLKRLFQPKMLFNKNINIAVLFERKISHDL
ncbi:olfactory receptor 6N2-like [Mixophyes fleayi]|uniref:olfactory receptor 6N2-like n=1 Tax=Mixophyes fleayi TaxID=3061075 RepID=UPI003F4DE091